jgi:PAS domain S-box-containing protein
MVNGGDVGSGVPNVVDTKMQESVVDDASQALAGIGASTGATALPRVLGDSPIAVLLVDRSHGTVTYANTAALELAGDVGLPVAVDAWTTAAGVTDIDGNALTDTAAPLSRVAAGQPVAGEPVRIRGTDGVADTDRGTADSRGPVVWATGFPLGEGAHDEQLSLLVFLPVEQPTGADDPEAVLQSLRERAVLATDICFTISDPRQEGNPLVWVNPSFTKVTGYSLEDSIGRNCKFLQGPATDPAAVRTIVDDLSAGRSTAVTLLNYRPDGTAFWNHVSISPVYDGAGELVSFVGVQSDVTSRILADAERDAAHEAERTARRHAEEARARMALMAEATTELVGSLDTAELQQRLARLCVPRLADWVSIWQVDEDGLITSATSLHRDGEVVRPLLDTMEAAFLGRPFPRAAPVREAFLTGQPVLREDLDDRALEPYARGLTEGEVLTQLGVGSLLALPLPSQRGTWGAMTLVREAAHGFSVEDLDVAQDLCRRAGQALDNARVYSREASVAETLQHALLPELPDLPRITAAARYTAASAAAAVGGDFYDLLPMPGGATGIVIGDVAGHDITAATAMGQLRGLIRSACWDTDEPAPDIVLARVDRLLKVLSLPVIATAALLRATPPADGGDAWVVECANAGHPPVLLRTPDGSVDLFCDDHDLLLGTGMADLLPPRSSTVHKVPVGSQLLLYTDGLIEQPGAEGPGRDIDAGLAALRQRWASLPVSADPRTVCDAVHDLVVLASDDLAVLTLQLD